MSPLTPLSSYTNSTSGPNCTPEQTVISSPEHSIASFQGCCISNGGGSTASSVCSPYGNNDLNNQSPESPSTAMTTISFSTSIPTSCTSSDMAYSTSSCISLANLERVPIEGHSINVQSQSNSFHCEELPFYMNDGIQEHCFDYSRNLSIHHPSSHPQIEMVSIYGE